jgi:hypothetical protein
MFPSAKTCARWKERKFVRQPHRMVIGLLVCFVAAICAAFSGEMEAAKLFGILTLIFLFFYSLANYIVWKASQTEMDC